jgi:hypothetical protein
MLHEQAEEHKVIWAAIVENGPDAPDVIAVSHRREALSMDNLAYARLFDEWSKITRASEASDADIQQVLLLD